MPLVTTSPFCLSLESSEATLTSAGGKGASLARMASAGLPVPAGFYLTTAAYRAFVEHNQLQERVVTILNEVNAADLSSVEAAASFIQAIFQEGRIPEEAAQVITTAYAALGRDKPVAVRSSATAEDLPGISFAGQQESFLNIRGGEVLLDAVRRCWASLWTARAIGYRARMGIDQSTVTMGVVVQVLVPAEVSGILFTANPSTGSREEMLVNASYGLGEAIVSSMVTPDAFRINRQTRSVLETTVGSKAKMVVSSAQGGVTVEEVAKPLQSRPCLTDAQLQQLIEMGLRIETIFDGFPQDIEWCWAGGQLWILQARPITGLAEAPVLPTKWEPPIKGSKWIRRQVAENMPDPLSPLFDELYLQEGLDISMTKMQQSMGVPRAMDKLYNRPIFGTVNGYAYMRADMNITPMMMPMVLGAMAAGVTSMLRGSGIHFWRERLREYQTQVEGWRGLNPGSMSAIELFDHIRQMAHADAVYWFGATLAFGTAKSSEGILDWFLKIFARRRNISTGMFLRGFSSKTLEAQALLEQIAGQIQVDQVLRARFLAAPADQCMKLLKKEPAAQTVFREIERYFAEYGHQTYSIDFAEPVLADTPTGVMTALQALVSEAGGQRSLQTEAIAAQRDALIAETLRSFGPVRRWLFKKVLGLALRYGPYREESLFYVGYAWPILRQCAGELGKRLVDAQALSDPQDIYFLTRQELGEAAAELSEAGTLVGRSGLARLAKYRQTLREARKQLHPPAAVPESFTFKLGAIDLSSRESQVRVKSSGPEMKGFAVSPGQVTAPACVILSPEDFSKMKAGCVLVCSTTTPAWTPLFSQAAGLVTDIGGVLAHGSIVAREFGLPAVMGTGDATVRIKDGQMITVDGTRGFVLLQGDK